MKSHFFLSSFVSNMYSLRAGARTAFSAAFYDISAFLELVFGWGTSRGAGDRQGQGGRLTPEGHEGWSTVWGLGGGDKTLNTRRIQL